MSDLYLVELVAWTATDVILSFFAWMPHFSLSTKRKKRERERKRDQVNQQGERYWLKHYHFLYWVLLTNLEAIYDYVWISICSCLMLNFFHIWTMMLSKLRMFTKSQVLFWTINRNKRTFFFFSFSHISYDKIIWIMINLHDDEHRIDNRKCLF